jgi:hypothetical protein
MEPPKKKGSAAYKRYYDKHRVELCEKMRVRDAKRREERRAYLAAHPEAVEAERAAMRDKYKRRIARQVLSQINVWLADKHVTDTFKTFLRMNVLANDAYKKLTPKTLNALAELPISKIGLIPPENIYGSGYENFSVITYADDGDGAGYDETETESEGTEETASYETESDESEGEEDLISAIRFP